MLVLRAIKNVSRSSEEEFPKNTHVDLHLLVETGVEDETVSYPYAMRLHGMACVVCEIPDIRIVEVRDLLRRSTISRRKGILQRRTYRRHRKGGEEIPEIELRKDKIR